MNQKLLFKPILSSLNLPTDLHDIIWSYFHNLKEDVESRKKLSDQWHEYFKWKAFEFKEDKYNCERASELLVEIKLYIQILRKKENYVIIKL